MEPVVSPYGINSDRNSYGFDSLKGEVRASAGSVTRDGSRSEQAPARDNRQYGIRPAADLPEEFQPYTPGGVRSSRQESRDRTEETAPPGPAAAGESDARTVQIVARLKAAEEKVKAHEAAHKTAGGTATGPVSYTYTRGPDGRNYITGGEVPIAITTGRTPQETISRMQVVIRAALAPADPSPQDRAVAAQASTIEQSARQELARSRDEGQNTGGTGSTAAPGGAVPVVPPITGRRQQDEAGGTTPPSAVAARRSAGPLMVPAYASPLPAAGRISLTG